MSFDLPADTIVPVDRISIGLDPEPHPFETANEAAIEENWRCETARNPALFDGRVALLASLGISGGVLGGRCHMVRYATFMLWRRRRPIAQAGHVYAHPMLVGSDNALVAIRMGPKTVNAGSVYFAAGSFEEADFVGGYADPDRNMRREVLEETGIDIAGVPHEQRFHLLSRPSGTVLFRRCFFDRSADRLAEEMRRHVAGQADPEIEGPVVIRSADDLPQGLADQMPDLIRWHFGSE